MTPHYEKFASNYILRNLIENPLPESTSWMPKTWGWAVITVLIAAISIVHIIKAVRFQWSNRYRKEALTALFSMPLTHPSDALNSFSRIIKITAAHAYPSSKVASLMQRPLLRFLDSHCPRSSSETNEGLDSELGLRWQSALFSPQSQTFTEDELIELRQRLSVWIKQHKMGDK